MRERTTWRWIWSAVLLQALGYVIDAVWHGVLHPGVEPRTVGGMARHLVTVHLPLYIGAILVLITTLTAVARRGRNSGIALLVAAAGAVVSTGAEAFHAISHVRLDTHAAPVAGTVSVLGFLVVVVALTVSGRRGRRSADVRRDRRAA